MLNRLHFRCLALGLGAVLSAPGILPAQARNFTELAGQSLARIEGTLQAPGLQAVRPSSRHRICTRPSRCPA